MVFDSAEESTVLSEGVSVGRAVTEGVIERRVVRWVRMVGKCIFDVFLRVVGWVWNVLWLIARSGCFDCEVVMMRVVEVQEGSLLYFIVSTKSI